MGKLFFCFLLLSFLSIHSTEEIKQYQIFDFIEMSQKEKNLKTEDFSSFSELQRWALFQGLYLQPNHPKGGFLGPQCRMIPNEGYQFYLQVEKLTQRKLFLYLDITTYEARQNKTYPVRSLYIFINNKWRKTVRFIPESVETNPILLEVDRRDIIDGRLTIKLLPEVEEGGKFWGIWDAFYTFEKDSP
jgi:hypothetical protein